MEWKARRRPREEGTGETPQRSEEAHGPPAGKRSAWNGNQRDYKLTTKKRKHNGSCVFLDGLSVIDFFWV
ncbi:hypothetical protein B4U37_07960 [Sutcliffiella horikoshii]|uniref:Uncharacterized protein n=1 Tax=Sutcliffiella horikoshii TaxID=79883 RepID=A0ABM6KI00_9BACI|nr:hypothetical protein B4U37_07960 [Sutcliffiella horikoshii]